MIIDYEFLLFTILNNIMCGDSSTIALIKKFERKEDFVVNEKSLSFHV